MRRRLRDIRSEAKNIDSIRTIRGAIEYILWYLTNTNTSDSTSGAITELTVSTTVSLNGKLYVPRVTALPPIPTEPETYAQVYWVASGGDPGQLWETYTGYTRWYPKSYTLRNGVPVP